MNLRDFYILNTKVLAILEKHDTTDQYNRLVDYLNNIRTSPTEDLQKAINDTFTNIDKLNHSIEHDIDTVPHSEFLFKTTNLGELVGVNASGRLLSILSNEFMFATAAISKITAEVTQLKQLLQMTIENINQYKLEFEMDDNLSIVSFEFDGDTDIKTTDALRSKLSEIEKIIHAFARLSGEPTAFAKPEIYSLSKSSPTSIDIIVNALNVAEHSIPTYCYLVSKGVNGQWIELSNRSILGSNMKSLKRASKVTQQSSKGLRSSRMM